MSGMQDYADSRYFQDDTALARILHEAPYLPRCSDDKTATRIRPRDYAIRYPYMQINRAGFVSWLIFDLDHANAAKWSDVGLPPPNLIVRNRASNHSHAYYAIVPVCTTEAATAKPIAYMRAIYEAFALKLDADPIFHSGPVAKTPGHRWWLTEELHSHVYELGELADYVELIPAGWRKPMRLDEVSHSRHCILFEKVRYYAYSIVNRERDSGTLASFTRLLEAHALEQNNFHEFGFTENLSMSSLRATIKSIARWTWERYTGSGRKHRGIMHLSDDLPLAERQQLAAARTHAVRKKAAELKIENARRTLLRKGQKITQASISRVAGLARQTVARYAHVWAQVSESVKPIVAAIIKRKEVKHAAHQVTAGFFRESAPGAPVDFPDPCLVVRDG